MRQFKIEVCNHLDDDSFDDYYGGYVKAKTPNEAVDYYINWLKEVFFQSNLEYIIEKYGTDDVYKAWEHVKKNLSFKVYECVKINSVDEYENQYLGSFT